MQDAHYKILSLAPKLLAILLMMVLPKTFADSVTLRDSVQVSGTFVTLKDLALLEGNEARRMADVRIAEFTEGNTELEIKIEDIRKQLSEHRANWAVLVVRGPIAVKATRVSEQVLRQKQYAEERERQAALKAAQKQEERQSREARKPTPKIIQARMKIGNAQVTERMLDVYIAGNGFFQVQKGNDIYYTRSGHFKINKESELMIPKAGGYRLYPELVIPEGTSEIVILRNGNVITLDNDGNQYQIGQIELAGFVNPEGLKQVGDHLYVSTDASGESIVGAPDGPEGLGALVQGFLEELQDKDYSVKHPLSESRIGKIPAFMKSDSVKHTGSPYDLYIKDDAFFVLHLPESEGGGLVYTRDGAMKLTAYGQLVHARTGYRLFSDVSIPDDATRVVIREDGAVIVEDAMGNQTNVGAIEVYGFIHPEKLKSIGQGLYVETAGSGGRIYVKSRDESMQGVLQGFLELPAESKAVVNQKKPAAVQVQSLKSNQGVSVQDHKVVASPEPLKSDSEPEFMTQGVSDPRQDRSVHAMHDQVIDSDDHDVLLSQVDRSTVRGVVEHWFKAKLGGHPDDVRVETRERDAAFLNQSSAGYQFEIDPAFDGGVGRQFVTVRRYQKGEYVDQTKMTMTIKKRVRAVALKQTMQRGDKITREHVRYDDIWIDSRNETIPISEIKEVEGKLLRTRMTAGSPLIPRLLEVDEWVKRGDLVTIRVHDGSVVIQTKGKAKQAGQEGDLIEVVDQNRRTMIGKVVGRRDVLVQGR